MNIGRTKFFTLEQIGIAVIILAMAAAFFFADRLSDNPTLEYRAEDIDIPQPWQAVTESGVSDVSFPLYLPDTGSITLVSRLPDISENTYLILWRQTQNAEIYVDGRLLFGTKRPASPGGVATLVGTQMVYEPVTPDMSGKEISVRLHGRSFVYIDSIRLVYSESYMLNFFRTYSGHVILIIILLFSAAVALIALVLLTAIAKPPETEDSGGGGASNASFFIYSVLFFLSTSLWLSTDIELFNLMTGRQAMAAVLSYISYSMIPLTLCMIIRSAMPNILRKTSAALAAVMMLNVACETAFFEIGVFDLPDMLTVTRVLYYAQAVFAAAALYELTLGKANSIYTGMRGAALKVLTGGQALLLLCFMLGELFFLSSITYQFMGLFGVGAFSFLSIIGSGAMMLGDVLMSAAEYRKTKKYIYFDAMTGVKNRYSWEMRMEELAAEAMPDGLAMFIIDINGLKVLNDTRGHSAGDRIIIDTADILGSVFGGLGDVYRIGGDEFAVICRITDSAPAALVKAVKDEAAAKRSHAYEELAVSIGFAESDGAAAVSPNALKEAADRMMYEDKARWYAERGIERRR